MLNFHPKLIVSCVTKDRGPLTKIMSLDPETGELVKDGSECSMHSGVIKQIPISSPDGFAKMLVSRQPNQAIVHGVCEHKTARVVTKGKVDQAGKSDMPVIARTKEYIAYADGPGVILLDHDKARFGAVGSDAALASYSPADLVKVLAQHVHAAIGQAAFVSTPSTSSCIYSATGELLRGEGTGSHTDLFVKKASDIPRYLPVLGKRLILAGFGRIELSSSGAMLLRTLADLLVARAERLVFVAGAVCRDGLEQRLPPPTVVDGEMLDTSTLPDLTAAEEQQYQEIVAALKELAKPGQAVVIAAYLEREAGKLAASQGVTVDAARKIIISRQDHVLDDCDLLYFAGKPEGVSVSEVLANGEAFHGKSLADPLEPDYEGGSRTKAKFFWNDGSPVVNSFAHGSVKYRFRRFVEAERLAGGAARHAEADQRAEQLRAELSSIISTGGQLTGAAWCAKLQAAKLTPQGEEAIFALLIDHKIGTKRVLKNEYRLFCEEAGVSDASQKFEAIARGRRQVHYSALEMNRVVEETEQGVVAVPGKWPFFDFGGLMGYSTYDTPARIGHSKDDQKPPDVPVIRPYTANNLQLRIEQSVLHFTFEERDHGGVVKIPVPTPTQVVLKMLDNPGSTAPRVTGLVTHPIITPGGEIICNEGICPNTGLLLQFGGATFTAPDMPSVEDARQAVVRLKETLFDEFPFRETPGHGDLYKTAAVALLLTGVFRKVMDQAPGGIIQATIQSSGKTALARAIHVALSGRDMAVSRLSDNADEISKSMLAILMENPAMVCFDNLPEGFEIADPTLAKVITAPYFKGRVLGRSQEISLPTNTLFAITGNNITLSADLVRRFLAVQLDVGQARPEHRSFKNPDIVQHVLNHRAQIVHDALTITKGYIDAGRPLSGQGLPGSGFGLWDQMVRFPLLWACGVDVLATFELSREESTEEQSMKGLMAGLWSMYGSSGFTATAVLRELQRDGLGDYDRDDVDHLRECVALFTPKALDNTRSLSWVLKKMLGRIVGGRTLRYSSEQSGNRGQYFILGGPPGSHQTETRPIFRGT